MGATRVITMVDRAGRTPMTRAAMLGDVLVFSLLWKYGRPGAAYNASILHDTGGFTALMHALRLNRVDAATWLTGTALVTLSDEDARVLQALGVDTTGIPRGERDVAPEHLGRGSLPWTHPSGVGFVNHPLQTTDEACEDKMSDCEAHKD